MNLGKLFKGMVLSSVLLMSSTCFAGLHDYPNVGLIQFDNKAAVSNSISFEDASMVSDYMVENLLDSGRFNVIEREQLKAILDEHLLNLTGLVDPSTAVQIGKISGVEYLVYGSIAGLSAERSTLAVGGIDGRKFKVTANIMVRFIDLQTGRIVLAARGKGTSSSTGMEFDFRRRHGYHPPRGTVVFIGKDAVSQVQVHNALAKAVDDAVNGSNGILAKMDGKAKRKY